MTLGPVGHRLQASLARHSRSTAASRGVSWSKSRLSSRSISWGFGDDVGYLEQQRVLCSGEAGPSAPGSLPAGTPTGELLDLLPWQAAWHADAACKEAPTGLSWSPDVGTSVRDIEAVKAVYVGCLALDECRAWALAHGAEMHGVWAGMTTWDRAAVRRWAAA